MYVFSSPSWWVRFFREFRCHHCGSSEGYVSRPRNYFERHGLWMFSMRMARCGECYRRSYRPSRVPLLPRPETMNLDPEQPLASTLSAERKVAEKQAQESGGSPRRIA